MSSAAAIPPPRKRISREEFESMIDAGIFAGQRCELIDGDLIDKMGQKPPHALTIHRTQSRLIRAVGSERVRIQLPIELRGRDRGWSLPEPDVAVLAEPSLDFERRHPRADETILIVEVADTTARYDLTTKRDLYAHSGAPQYWVLDLARRALIVHRDLRADSAAYADIRVVQAHETVPFAGGEIAVEDLLPHNT